MSRECDSIALVLRRSDSGESDRRVVLFTRDFGKLSVIAKGARKGGSRLASATEPLGLARFVWAEGKFQKFVTSVQPVTSFPEIRKDYDRLSCALAWIEVLDHLITEGTSEPENFELARSVLESFQAADSAPAVLAWGIAALLSNEGHYPDWANCVITGRPLEDNPAVFSPLAGGYVSVASGQRFQDQLEISAESLIALSRLPQLAEPPKRIIPLQDCLIALAALTRHIAERPLPATQSVLDALRYQLG